MAGRLPLTQLRAFEAACRLGSFAAAAQELAVTPSAVSHAIRELERMLGTVLFQRSPRKVEPTPEGRTLYQHVTRGFDQLQRGLQEITTAGPARIRVHCAPSFAAQWLSPRLGRFLGLYPAVELKLSASPDYPLFPSEEYDLSIVYGEPRQTDVVAIPLGQETVCPLCTPGIASRVTAIDDLLSVPLVRSDHNRVTWPMWFDANSAIAATPAGPRFDRSFMAIAAAVNGVGVVLESTRLAERELQSGQLVAPLEGRSQSLRHVAHWMVWPKGAERKHAFRCFVTWLVGELGIPSVEFDTVTAGYRSPPG